ncbi:hypothetical protein [Thermococcus sp.]|uniref:hypothetical protein n=1 Tax=Thermococcus sp. TaxID=35749 RepID=UPI002616FBAC|nr:hypothetical protein [Thermococcus sp.]
MELPAVKPLVENYLCRNKEEFGNLILKTLQKGKGAFFKIFGKTQGNPYYITVLLDHEKLLAAESENVSAGSSLVGKPAVEILKDILEEGPVIVDAFPLTDVELKMSIVENLEVYNSTPKLKLREICPSIGGVSTEPSETERGSRTARPMVSTETLSTAGSNPKETAIEKELPSEGPRLKKRRTEVTIRAPVEIDPYFRGMVSRLKGILRNFGIQPNAIEIEAKEVRYALGAGYGIHAIIKITSEEKLPQNVREEVERFIYKEAGEISQEIGKRVVISRIEFY